MEGGEGQELELQFFFFASAAHPSFHRVEDSPSSGSCKSVELALLRHSCLRGGECASGHCPWRSLSPAQGPLGPGDKFRGKISRSVWKKSRIVNGLRIHGGDCQACGL